jgi:hypothetical protein
MSERFYVYVYKDAAGAPKYVGKGAGQRDRDHISIAKALNDGRRLEKATHFTRWLAKCLRTGATFTIERWYEDLDEEVALALEIDTIAALGRWRIDNGGVLLNKLVGGDGITSADALRFAATPGVKEKRAAARAKLLADPAFRERLSAATKESNGRPHRREQMRTRATQQWSEPAALQAKREQAARQWADPAWQAARKEELVARNTSASMKSGNRARMQALWASDEFRERQRERMRKNNPNKRKES